MSRRFRICMAKGGRESARPSYGSPKLTLISREKKIALGGVTKSPAVTILTLEQNPPERNFLTYIKIFSQEDFALTRSYAALRAADLDWIVRPGYSSSGYILEKNLEKPTWNHENYSFAKYYVLSNHNNFGRGKGGRAGISKNVTEGGSQLTF